MSTDIDDISERVFNKVDKSEAERLWKETKRFPTNVDFKELYNKTLIPVQEHQELINIYQSEHK